jgi:hypothetical protein
MIYVEGVTPDGVAYAVYVDASEDELADMGVGMPGSYGETVHGTPSIIAMLRVEDGQPVPVTPTGPYRPLSSTDPETVVGWRPGKTWPPPPAATWGGSSLPRRLRQAATRSFTDRRVDISASRHFRNLLARRPVLTGVPRHSGFCDRRPGDDRCRDDEHAARTRHRDQV